MTLRVQTAKGMRFCIDGLLKYILFFLTLVFKKTFGLSVQLAQGSSSLTRDQNQAAVAKAPSPNYWTAREFPCIDGS